MREPLVVALAANAHDSSVAIGDAERILVLAEAERFYRVKRKWCQREEFEALIEQALGWLGRDVDDVTHWCGTAMLNPFLPRESRYCAWTDTHRVELCGRRVELHCVNHHLAHAGCTFAFDVDDAAVDATDGGGDLRMRACFRVRGEVIEPLECSDSFTGRFYDTLSYYVYKRFCQEGKLMGLAPFGMLDAETVDFLDEHAELLSTASYEDGYELLHDRFALDRFDAEDQRVRDLARAAQHVFERRRVTQLEELADVSPNLVLTGGAALNIHANSCAAEALPGHRILVPPFCDDTGQAVGACLYELRCRLGAPTRCELPFLGVGARADPVDDATIDRVVQDLLADRVVAWHWGRAEVGPRALGHRSLLCSPRRVENRVLVSERVKRREPYRPVAPIVLADRREDWFSGLDFDSPYMLFAAAARAKAVESAPAIVHVDGSARIQTIERDASDPVAAILDRFEQATGVPMLVNTSLNGPGEPISNSAVDTLAFAASRPEVVPYVDGHRAAA